MIILIYFFSSLAVKITQAKVSLFTGVF